MRQRARLACHGFMGARLLWIHRKAPGASQRFRGFSEGHLLLPGTAQARCSDCEPCNLGTLTCPSHSLRKSTCSFQTGQQPVKKRRSL